MYHLQSCCTPTSSKGASSLELSNPSSGFKGCSCELSPSKGTAGAGHAVYSTDTAQPLQCLYWHPSLYKHCCHRQSRLAAIRAALDPEKYPKAQEKSSCSHTVMPRIKSIHSQVTQQLNWAWHDFLPNSPQHRTSFTG